MTCYECVHGMAEPPSFCPHTKLLADGKEHMVEIHEKRLGGDFIVSVSPLHDSDATFRDVFKVNLIYESNWAVIVIIHVEPIHFS